MISQAMFSRISPVTCCGRTVSSLGYLILYLALRPFVDPQGVTSRAPPCPDLLMLSKIRERVRTHRSCSSGCQLHLGADTSFSSSNCLTIARCLEARFKSAL